MTVIPKVQSLPPPTRRRIVVSSPATSDTENGGESTESEENIGSEEGGDYIDIFKEGSREEEYSADRETRTEKPLNIYETVIVAKDVYDPKELDKIQEMKKESKKEKEEELFDIKEIGKIEYNKQN